MNFKVRQCKTCGEPYKQYNSLVRHCSPVCKSKDKEEVKKAKIKPVSEKRKPFNAIYQKIRIEVLTEANFKCFIEGCKNVATTVEHTAGRKGFYDDLAREQNIPLLIDKRFLQACCFKHNSELENNTELSRKYQLSKIHGGDKNITKS